MTRLASGIPLLDRTWEGLRPGETYVVTGRAQSATAVLLRVAQATAEQTATDTDVGCVYVTSTAPATLATHAADLGFDIRAATQQQGLRLLRPPKLPEGAEPVEGLTSLARLAQQSGPALLVIEDFTPFLAFRDLGALADGVQRLVGALHPLPTVLLLGLGAPANDRSAAITQRLCDAVAGAIQVELQGATDRTLRLRPGTNIALPPATGTWTPGETDPPAASTSPTPDAPAVDAPPRVPPQGDGYGDGFAPKGGVGRQLIGSQRLAAPSQEDAPAPRTSSPTPSPGSPPAFEMTQLPPEGTPPSAPMPSVAELNAGLADIFGASSSPPDAPPARPPFEHALSPAAEPPSPNPSAPAPSSPDLDRRMTSPSAPKISALDLNAAVFEVNPHLRPNEFELDGGVLMDSWDAAHGAQTLGGSNVSLEPGPTFRTPGSPFSGGSAPSPMRAPSPSGDGLARSPSGAPSFDFTGAPEFDSAPTPAPMRDPFAPAPAAMPEFASLAQHTFDQSPRGLFSKVLQGAFDTHVRKGRPFLALAMRMDPANPFAEAFPLVEDAVRAAIDKRDPLYAEPERKRLLALLPERTQSAAAGIYGAIKAQLQLSGGASDAVFTAIAAVTIPNGAPFANARDLMAFAFDAD
ncbi:MAG: hypothetical protein AAF624_05325 [Bacteroidota bacterium]